MKTPLHSLAVAALLALPAAAQNVLPNGNFEGNDPLKGWITAFPDEAWYKDNAQYVKLAPEKSRPGHRAVVLDLAPGIAGNQGGKIESVPVKVVPGGKYRIEVDCMTWDFSAKIHAEAWTTDPHPEQKRTIFRRAPKDGRPALMMCFRAQLPDAPDKGKTWSTASREFTVPLKVTVAGNEQAPEYITVKAVAYAATPSAGKSYFSNFRLTLLGVADKPAR
jgi:hypothetical protein